MENLFRWFVLVVPLLLKSDETGTPFCWMCVTVLLKTPLELLLLCLGAGVWRGYVTESEFIIWSGYRLAFSRQEANCALSARGESSGVDQQRANNIL